MSGLTMACVSDLAGMVRGKGFATGDFDKKLTRGIGWTPTNAQITCFDSIAASPYGALGDLVLRPAPEARAEAPLPDGATLSFVLGDVFDLSGKPWECCTRSALKAALERFRDVTGLELRATFEHEFMLGTLDKSRSFTLRGFREGQPFARALLTALDGADIQPDSFLREYGPGQFEVTVPPKDALRAADEAVMLREITRAVAAAMDLPVTFTPLLNDGTVGNGVHIHFSLWTPEGEPATTDGNALSPVASGFIAGILKHLNAVAAFTAPSGISYRRLQPHRWSAWINNLGDKDREAAIRICPVSATDPGERAKQANFELRVVDAAASPHLALAAVVNAATLGIEAGLSAPTPTTEDLSLLSQEDLTSRGLTPLPSDLPAALDALQADEAFCATLPGNLVDIYIAHKKGEAAYLADKELADVFALYAQTY